MTHSLTERWGQATRDRRLSAGLSLETLAEKVQIDIGHLSRFERGLAGIGDATRIRLAQALHCRVEDLFSYDPEDTCPSAANATDGAPSPTPATTAATPSRARSAPGPAKSAGSDGPSGREGGAA